MSPSYPTLPPTDDSRPRLVATLPALQPAGLRSSQTPALDEKRQVCWIKPPGVRA